MRRGGDPFNTFGRIGFRQVSSVLVDVEQDFARGKLSRGRGLAATPNALVCRQ